MSDLVPPSSDRRMNESPGPANKKMLTQYQRALKRAERERQRIMREHQMELERRKKQEEKELKSREKQAKKNEEERIKEEKRQRRLEEQRKREEEKDAERKRREEEKRKKDEERIQKELERKREEDCKIKKEEKQRAVLLGFLVKTEQKKETTSALSLPFGPFMQFELRKDMRMAPLHRVTPNDLYLKRSNLDSLFEHFITVESGVPSASLGLMKSGETNYLHELQTGQHTPLSCQSTWPNESPNAQLLNDGLCSIVNWPALKYHGNRGSGGTVWLRAKLLQFVENYRPAYYGTWRRRSCIVTGRRPFARDHTKLDYMVDSDDEWEEEEPGESITQSENDDEEEKEEEDDEDEDDHFLVPHGYLSDDEGVAAEDAGEEDAGNEEMKTLRRNLSAVEYEVAHRRGLHRLKPIMSGPMWLPDPADSRPSTFATQLEADKENVENIVTQEPDSLDRMGVTATRSNLSVYRVHLWEGTVPIPIRLDTTPTPTGRRTKKELPEDAIPYLIHLVHKSPLGKPKLAFEFRVFWHQHTTGTMPECTQYLEFKKYTAAAANAGAQRCGAVLSGPAWDDFALSQNLILTKIVEIAVFEEGRWAVHPEVIRRFGARLATITGIDELLRLDASTDDEAVSSIVFPPWHYLTDVVVITKKVSRSSTAKRRSLEAPVPTELESPQPSTTVSSAHPMPNDSLRVLVEPLKPLDKSTTCIPTTAAESKRAILATLQSTPPHVPRTPDRVATVEIFKTEKDSTVNSTPVNRKRVTLYTFFTPPTKRQHTDKNDHTELSNIIGVDSP